MRLSPMKIVERYMTRLSYRAKGQGNRHSQLIGHLKNHPTPVLLPVPGEETHEGGLGTGRGRHKRGQTKHVVKTMISGAVQRMRTVLLTAMDGASNGIGSRRIGTIFTSISSDSVQLARKLAERPKERNVI